MAAVSRRTVRRLADRDPRQHGRTGHPGAFHPSIQPAALFVFHPHGCSSISSVVNPHHENCPVNDTLSSNVPKCHGCCLIVWSRLPNLSGCFFYSSLLSAESVASAEQPAHHGQRSTVQRRSSPDGDSFAAIVRRRRRRRRRRSPRQPLAPSTKPTGLIFGSVGLGSNLTEFLQVLLRLN